MRFKLDENLPARAAELLDDAGHDTATVVSQKMVGAPDSEIAATVKRENRILVTLDTDFADIRTYPPEDYTGLLVLRPERQDIGSVTTLLEQTLPLVEDEFSSGSLWIVEEHRVRIRE